MIPRSLFEANWDIGDIGLFPFIGGALLCLFFFWYGFYGLFRRLGKNFDEIHIFENDIEILYEDGSTGIFNVTDIRKYRLTNPWNIGKIVFKDGTTIRDVERVSYWPILRKYLLARVDPLGKGLQGL